MNTTSRLGSVAGLICGALALAGCDRTAPPPAKPAQAPDAAPALRLGEGVTYEPDALTEGFPGVATICVGDRLRMYAVGGRWTPATLSLIDEKGETMTSLRMDLPPAGRVTLPLPPTPTPAASVRLTSPAGSFDSSAFERRIGLVEPEFTHERLLALGIGESESVRELTPSGPMTRSGSSSIIRSHEGSLQPLFGTVKVVGSNYSATLVADQWDGPGAMPDDRWLNDRVREAIKDGVRSSGAMQEPRSGAGSDAGPGL